MTTLASDVGSPLGAVANLRGRAWVALLIWLGASAIAIFFALVVSDSTLVDGSYLPRGGDFVCCHARKPIIACIIFADMIQTQILIIAGAIGAGPFAIGVRRAKFPAFRASGISTWPHRSAHAAMKPVWIAGS